MYGIAGIAGEVEQTLAAGAVGRMISTPARRGPDSDGIEIWNSAVLGIEDLLYSILAKPDDSRCFHPTG